jgi:hypothetical protein
MGNTRSKFEKIAGKRIAKTNNPANDAHYQEILALLLAWDGNDSDTLRAELQRRSRARKMPALPELDMSDKHDPGVEFVEMMINQVAERLSVAVIAPSFNRGSDTESRQESETARRIREKNLGLIG